MHVVFGIETRFRVYRSCNTWCTGYVITYLELSYITQYTHIQHTLYLKRKIN